MFDGNRKTGIAPADFVLRKCFPGQVRPQHSPDVVVVEVPGIQGPAGAKHGVLFTEQNLTEEQKEQARKNIGAVSLLQSIEIQGFSVRWCGRVLEASSAGNLLDELEPKKNVREGDSVIDASRNLYQIVRIDQAAGTYSITKSLARLGVLDYRELSNLPHLGKLSELDYVGRTELSTSIDFVKI